jgi:hypothetical protein
MNGPEASSWRDLHCQKMKITVVGLLEIEPDRLDGKSGVRKTLDIRGLLS